MSEPVQKRTTVKGKGRIRITYGNGQPPVEMIGSITISPQLAGVIKLQEQFADLLVDRTVSPVFGTRAGQMVQRTEITVDRKYQGQPLKCIVYGPPLPNSREEEEAFIARVQDVGFALCRFSLRQPKYVSKPVYSHERDAELKTLTEQGYGFVNQLGGIKILWCSALRDNRAGHGYLAPLSEQEVVNAPFQHWVSRMDDTPRHCYTELSTVWRRFRNKLLKEKTGDILATETEQQPITQARINKAFNRVSPNEQLAHILEKTKRHL